MRQRGTFSSFIVRLAIAATGVGVAVMILALAFITGFRHTIRDKLFSFWGEVLVVNYDPYASEIVSSVPIKKDARLEQQLRAMPEAEQVAPFALRPAILQAGDVMEGIRLKGVPQDFKFPASITFTGAPLTYPDTAYGQGIILSQTTATRLNVKAGDVLLTYFMEPGAPPRVRKLSIAGLYHTGMEEVDKSFALADIRLVQKLAGWEPQQVSGYQVTLRDPLLADTMAAQIHDRYLAAPVTARSVPEIFEGVFGWLGMLSVNQRVLLIILSLVAIINLSAAVIILMVDRAVMLGLLQALGMPAGNLWQLFGWVSAIIGFSGVLLGNVLALGIAWAQSAFGFIKLPEETYYVRTAPVQVVWWHVLAVDAGTLALCVICTALPLLYIRRIHPARVLSFR